MAANRGYVAHGREKDVPLDETGTEGELRKIVPDLKVTMEIGRDDQPETPNMWPTGDEGAAAFKKEMATFFETCKSLHMQVMRAIALGMVMKESWFDSFTDAGDNTLRLLHYPGVSKQVFRRDDGHLQVRASEPSDYGSVTLLLQDANGGFKYGHPKAHSSMPRQLKEQSLSMPVICLQMVKWNLQINEPSCD